MFFFVSKVICIKTVSQNAPFLCFSLSIVATGQPNHSAQAAGAFQFRSSSQSELIKLERATFCIIGIKEKDKHKG